MPFKTQVMQRAVFTPTRMIAAFMVIFSILAIIRWHLWSYGPDTGLFSQAIFSMGQGALDGPEAGSHFRFHWSPILALLTPLVMVFRSPLTLQLIQVFCIAATANPLYFLVKRYADRALARTAVAITLLYAPLFSIAFEEFHELAFYPVLAIGLIDAADRRAWRSFALIALAALCVREDVLLLLMATGLVLIGIAFGRFKPALGANLANPQAGYAGIGLIATALITMFGYFDIVIPRIGTWAPSHFYVYPFANGPIALLLALIKNPLLLGTFFTMGRGTYLLEAFLPLLLLPLRSIWLLPGVPGLLLILLTSSALVWRMGEHYAALWIPWVLLATCDVLIRMRNQDKKAQLRTSVRGVLASLVVVVFTCNPMHLGYYLKPVPEREQAHQAIQALAHVPHDAHLLLPYQWYSRIALEYPNSTPYISTPYDWVVVSLDTDTKEVRDVWLPHFAEGVRTGQLQSVARYGNVLVYHRTNSP